MSKIRYGGNEPFRDPLGNHQLDHFYEGHSISRSLPIEAVGNDNFCDTTATYSQRRSTPTSHVKKGVPQSITVVGYSPSDPTTIPCPSNSPTAQWPIEHSDSPAVLALCLCHDLAEVAVIAVGGIQVEAGLT